jgi:hypothetical protein
LAAELNPLIDVKNLDHPMPEPNSLPIATAHAPMATRILSTIGYSVYLYIGLLVCLVYVGAVVPEYINHFKANDTLLPQPTVMAIRLAEFVNRNISVVCAISFLFIPLSIFGCLSLPVKLKWLCAGWCLFCMLALLLTLFWFSFAMAFAFQPTQPGT